MRRRALLASAATLPFFLTGTAIARDVDLRFAEACRRLAGTGAFPAFFVAAAQAALEQEFGTDPVAALTSAAADWTEGKALPDAVEPVAKRLLCILYTGETAPDSRATAPRSTPGRWPGRHSASPSRQACAAAPSPPGNAHDLECRSIGQLRRRGRRLGRRRRAHRLRTRAEKAERGDPGSRTQPRPRRAHRNLRANPRKGPQSAYPPDPFAPFPDDGEYDKFYVDEKESNQPFIGAYLRLVGGTSWHWTGFADRLRPADFRMESRYGVAEDWPITYEYLDGYLRGGREAMGRGRRAGIQLGRAARRNPYPMPPIPHELRRSPVVEAARKPSACMRPLVPMAATPNSLRRPAGLLRQQHLRADLSDRRQIRCLGPCRKGGGRRCQAA